MRTLTHAGFLFCSFALLSACNAEEDSLGTKGSNQNGTEACDGPDPSTLGCGDGTACPTGMVCDPNACVSSSCGCDEETGNWVCTADCGLGACVPEDQPPVCEGPNPADGCDGGCPTGTVCDPNACRPSSCGCDATTGSWMCTADCGEGGACIPDTLTPCEGPDPSEGCDNGCPTGTVCDPAACRPSHCQCDTTIGGWLCTADCGEGGQCVPG
jgi:hypothetical protein